MNEHKVAPHPDLRALEASITALIAEQIKLAVAAERSIWLDVIRLAGLDVTEAEKTAAGLRDSKK